MRRSGMTLVEVAVSLALIVIGVLSVVTQWSSGTRGLVASMNSTGAVFLAERELERLHMVPYSELRPGTGPWEDQGPYGFRVTIRWMDEASHAVEATVTVRWNELGRSVSHHLSTVIAKDYP